MSRKITYAEVKEFVKNNSDCELLSEAYEGTFEPMKFRCSCGKEFETSWHKFRSQGRRSCVECALKKRSDQRRKSMDEVKTSIAALGCEYVSGEYKNGKSKIVIRCRCGHDREIIYNNLFQKNFTGLCNECAYPLYHGVNRLTIDQVREMCVDRGLELLSDSYTNAREKLRFRCSCGEEFETTWDSVFSKGKTQCDRCSQRESSGERAISEWLDEHSIEYEKEKKFPGFVGLAGKHYRFDFYIPSKNLCIEFDGQQHSKTVNYSGKEDQGRLNTILLVTQLHDQLKTFYCEKVGIDLLRINYTELDKLSGILADKLIPR